MSFPALTNREDHAWPGLVREERLRATQEPGGWEGADGDPNRASAEVGRAAVDQIVAQTVGDPAVVRATRPAACRLATMKGPAAWCLAGRRAPRWCGNDGPPMAPPGWPLTWDQAADQKTPDTWRPGTVSIVPCDRRRGKSPAGP